MCSVHSQREPISDGSSIGSKSTPPRPSRETPPGRSRAICTVCAQCFSDSADATTAPFGPRRRTGNASEQSLAVTEMGVKTSEIDNGFDSQMEIGIESEMEIGFESEMEIAFESVSEHVKAKARASAPFCESEQITE